MSNFEIWKRGITLAQADLHFAPIELRDAYEVARARAGETPELYNLDPAKVPFATRAKIVSQTMQEFFAPYVAIRGIRNEMRDRLLRSLAAEKLRAYGYKVPREPGDEPVRLPVDIFEARFTNSEKSSIKGVRLEFVSVRIIRSSEAQKIETQSPSASNKQMLKKAPGRPTGRDQIRAAIMSLYKDGTLPNKKKRTTNAAAAKDRVNEMFPGKFPDGKGLGEDTLCNILKIIEEERKQGR